MNFIRRGLGRESGGGGGGIHHGSVYRMSACVSTPSPLPPRGGVCIKGKREQRGNSISRPQAREAPAAPPTRSALPHPTVGVTLSLGQSVDRCCRLEDVHQLAEIPYASSECAAWLEETHARTAWSRTRPDSGEKLLLIRVRTELARKNHMYMILTRGM